MVKQAAKTSGVYPEKITTDKEPALYPAIEYEVYQKRWRIEEFHKSVSAGNSTVFEQFYALAA